MKKARLEGGDSEPINYEWVFRITKAKYQEQEGVPIVRIMGQLSSIDSVIYNDLEQGARNPEGIWGLLVQGKRPQIGGRNLNNREIYSYIEDCIIVKNHRLADVIKRHCLAIELMGDLEETVSATFRWEISNFLKIS